MPIGTVNPRLFTLTFLREYYKIAGHCATEGARTFAMMHLAEMGMINRELRMVERRIKSSKLPTVKSLDNFDFLAMPSLNKILELVRSNYVGRREGNIAIGNSCRGLRS